MLFNSCKFLLFFPAIVLLYFVLPKKARQSWLLAASYVFYMGWNPKYALLLLFSTAVTYGAARLVQHTRDKGGARANFVPIVAICLTLCLLFYYKYLNFTLALVERLFAVAHVGVTVPQSDILLPVGISFFTFQAIGYLVDVWRGDVCAERNFLRYALFVSFFPQLVAGPIERSKSLLAQLEEPKSFDFARAKSGLFTMLYGYLLKMVIADRAAILVDFVFANQSATGVQVAFATFIFAFQIYCDFYGYSVIALGAARILGITLMENFNALYFSASFREFWRRWHISLSTWFRDYLYIPLGGSRKGRFRKNLNTMIVMLASGVWHGAGLRFVAWGFLNGAFQIVDELTADMRKHAEERARRIVILPVLIEREGSGLEVRGVRLSHLFRMAQIAATFCLVCLCWLFFRAGSLKIALRCLKRIVLHPRLSTLAGDWVVKYGMGRRELLFLLVSIACLLAVDFLKLRGVSAQDALLKRNWLAQAAVLIVAVFVIAVFGVWGAGYNAAAFIYFQF